ncbi:DUF402 domain-containing protein [Hoyosella sp. G463]|uniref:DUF402 domain-containing protein n=1 Tax=Lolliginicoccus lacisalsi TaxID=2742202 RepID=A0A927PKS3_9ACTN|nr:DUF402 domain-containing protein [Lolliginicoccus lacisalsi]MBD8506345.1 DUF402 domain-containing protein [Lolliginicoccus lacisalsi]
MPERPASHSPGVHPPKFETFDLAAGTNTDPKGFVRAVDTYVAEPWGLYMGRPADHRQFHYMESWLLPSMRIRVTIFHFNPGHERDQDYYIDIGEFAAGEQAWTSVDHYLDIIVREGRDAYLEDVDELLIAHKEGLVAAEEASTAVLTATTVMSGIAGHGHCLMKWLAAEGMPLRWRSPAS